MEFRLLCCLLLLIWFIESCKKKDHPTYYISDQRLRDAANINKGSYFIYQDSATTLEDSFWVYTYTNRIYEDVGFSAEQVGYVLVKASQTYDIQFFASGSNNSLYGSYGSFVHIHAVTLPFTEGGSASEDNTKWNFIKHYDSLQVNGFFYKDVYEMMTTRDANYFHSYYSITNGLIGWSSNIGGETKSFSLKRSFIVH